MIAANFHDAWHEKPLPMLVHLVQWRQRLRTCETDVAAGFVPPGESALDARHLDQIAGEIVDIVH